MKLGELLACAVVVAFFAVAAVGGCALSKDSERCERAGGVMIKSGAGFSARYSCVKAPIVDMDAVEVSP